MSQKVRILRVDVRGASPYLGEHTTGGSDPDGPPTLVDRWSRNGADIMDWLCDAHRFRFNQLRSRREKSVPVENEVTGETEWVTVPVGKSVDHQTEKEARAEHSFLASVPYYLFHHPEKAEAKDWFGALKRRRTLRAKGADPGTLPGFRRRGRDHQRFGVHYNGGRRMEYRQVSKRRGIVVIRGMNAKGNARPGEGLGQKFEIRVHVRTSQPIRTFTSVEVDWTARTLVFVNDPAPLKGAEPTGAAVGLDGGVAHTLSTSDGAHHDLPYERLAELDTQVKRHQKRMAKSREVAKAQGRRHWESKRYQAHRAAAAKAQESMANVREDFWNKTTTELVRAHDVLVVEDLNLKAMTKRAKLVNVAQKSGLNRVMLRSGLGLGRAKLEYKSRANGKTMVAVNAAYSSQECSECGHTCRENRKSQALFSCAACGHAENADTNAAKVLLSRGLAALGLGEAQDRGGRPRAGSKRKPGAAADAAAQDSPVAVAVAALNREPAPV